MKMNEDEFEEDFSFFESDESLLGMNMTFIKRESRKRSKLKTNVLLIFISIIFTLAHYAFPKTKVISILIFSNNDYKRCELLNKLDLYQYDIKYIFLFLMYSYINIFSAFIYLTLYILCDILNDIICFLYFEPRPFWESNGDSFPCVCELTPASPSHTASNSFLFLSLFYFLREEVKQRNKYKKLNPIIQTKEYKENNDENSELNSSNNLSQSRIDKYSNFWLNVCLIFTIILIIFVDLIPLLQNIEYLHQTFFGISIGFSFYYWVFHIVRVNHLNKKHFMKIINQPFIIMTFSIILMIIIFFIHSKVINNMLISQMVEIEKFCKIPKDFNQSNEILKECIKFFELLGAYFGLLLEYKITFKSVEHRFIFYNVKSKSGEQYNQEQGAIINILRFLFLFFTEYLFFKAIFEFWVKNNLKGNFQLLVLSLVYFFKGIFFFFIMKIILRKLRLTNNKIFEDDDDDDDDDDDELKY
mgnify:CR=1 FL=1